MVNIQRYVRTIAHAGIARARVHACTVCMRDVVALMADTGSGKDRKVWGEASCNVVDGDAPWEPLLTTA